MLGKLLKYDFRAMWKQFSIIWPAALVIALINRFTLPFNTKGGLVANNELVAVITMSVFVGVMCAMFVVAMVFVLTRFYKGLLGDEGYLMHTLPVQTWQLILSKLICALAVTILNVVVSMLAMVLMMPIDWTDLFDVIMWQRLVQGLAQQPDAILYLVEFFLMVIMAMALMIAVVYLSMAIGHLFHRRRIFMSVVAFFAIDIVGNIVLTLLANTGLAYEITTLGGHLSFWIGIVLLAIPAVVLFLATSYILKNRLNLE